MTPVPLPEEELDREFYSETSSSAYEKRNNTGSRTPLLNNEELNPSLRFHDCETLSRSLSRGASIPFRSGSNA